MFDEIFVRVIKLLLMIFVILGLVVIVYAKITDLKIEKNVFIVGIVGAIFYIILMGIFISQNMKYDSIIIEDIKNKDKIIKIFEKDYEKIYIDNEKLEYKCKVYPKSIYKDVIITVKIDSKNNKINVNAPKYVIKKLKKINK